MAEERPRKVPAGVATALLVEGAEILGILGVLDDDSPLAGVEPSGSGVAGGHDAVEHVDSQRDGLQDVLGLSDSHEVERNLRRDQGAGQADHLPHLLLALPHRKPTYGDSPHRKLQGSPRRKGPEFGIDPPLGNGEEGSRRGQLGVPLEGPLLPPQSRLQGTADLLSGGGGFDQVVQGHHDVHADLRLHLHHRFRGEEHGAPVQGRTEMNPLFGDLGQGGEGENLVPAAVGQNRPLPPDEVVEGSGLLDQLLSRTGGDMVEVVKDDLGPEGLQIFRGHGLHRPLGSHGHEDGSPHLSVGSLQEPRPCGGATVSVKKMEAVGHPWSPQERLHAPWKG